MGSARVPSPTLAPPARAAPHPDHGVRQRGGRRPVRERRDDCPRGGEGRGERGHRAPAREQRALDGGEYQLPWERPPAWLYLPHQFDLFGARNIPVERRDGPHGEGDDPRTGDGNLHGPRTDELGCGEGDRRDATGGAIRGRGSPLGQRGEENSGRDNWREGGAAGDPERRIRGPESGLGAREDERRRKAEARLAAANAHLARSLEDHAERVQKRKAEGGIEHGPKQTAAERMLALRRRIMERSRAERNADGWHACSTAPEPGEPRVARQVQKTKEVSKIHYDVLHREGAELDTAEAEGNDAVCAEGRRDIARCEGGGATGLLAQTEEGRRGPGVIPAAVAAAASSGAWHAIGRSGAA